MSFEFQFNHFLNDLSNTCAERMEVVDISAGKLLPARENFYDISDGERLRKLEDSIELMGVQQPLIVRPKEGGMFEILSGHSRCRAVMRLYERKRIAKDLLPCIIDSEGDETLCELKLIMTNSTQRERTPAEKMHEVERLRVLLERYKKEHPEFKGNMQKIVANALGVSKSEVGRLDNINKHLDPTLKEQFEKGTLNVSVANELARLPEETQKEMGEKIELQGKLSLQEVKEAYARQIMEAGREEPEQPRKAGGEEGLVNWQGNRDLAITFKAEGSSVQEGNPEDTEPDGGGTYTAAYFLSEQQEKLSFMERRFAAGDVLPEKTIERQKYIVEGLKMLVDSEVKHG